MEKKEKNTLLKNFNALIEFLSRKDEKITLIITGGFALHFYGISRTTLDIDGEISCSDKTYEELMEWAEKNSIILNLGDNISRWGLIPLPHGYRKRAKTVMKKKKVIVKVLDPVDYVFSKLARGTVQDESDALKVCRQKNITPARIKRRLKKLELPKDPETRFFLDRLKLFIEKLENTDL